MDDRKGEFKTIPKGVFEKKVQEPDSGVFREGETLVIRGSRFRVAGIFKRKMILKLLPALKKEKNENP